jgi:hypothetical protein
MSEITLAETHDVLTIQAEQRNETLSRLLREFHDTIQRLKITVVDIARLDWEVEYFEDWKRLGYESITDYRLAVGLDKETFIARFSQPSWYSLQQIKRVLPHIPPDDLAEIGAKIAPLGRLKGRVDSVTDNGEAWQEWIERAKDKTVSFNDFSKEVTIHADKKLGKYDAIEAQKHRVALVFTQSMFDVWSDVFTNVYSPTVPKQFEPSAEYRNAVILINAQNPDGASQLATIGVYLERLEAWNEDGLDLSAYETFIDDLIIRLHELKNHETPPKPD